MDTALLIFELECRDTGDQLLGKLLELFNNLHTLIGQHRVSFCLGGHIMYVANNIFRSNRVVFGNDQYITDLFLGIHDALKDTIDFVIQILGRNLTLFGKRYALSHIVNSRCNSGMNIGDCL